MSFSKLTTRRSPNGGRWDTRPSRVDRFIVHHAATTGLEGVLSMMDGGSREVSANYVVKDRNIVGVVPENLRAWTSGSYSWDGRAITVETCNSEAGDASGWPISEESYRSLARLIADCAARYGFPLDREHVIGHRELYQRYGASYATACPGGINMDRLVRMAREEQQGEGFMAGISERQQQELYETVKNMSALLGQHLAPAIGRLDIHRAREEQNWAAFRGLLRQELERDNIAEADRVAERVAKILAGQS